MFLDYWVGSLDFNFMVEIIWGFPLNPQKVNHFLRRGQQQQSVSRRTFHVHSFQGYESFQETTQNPGETDLVFEKNDG